MLRRALGGAAIVVALIIVVNGVVMVVSPRAWFHLSNWLRATGSLTEREYGTGWGAMQVRLVGAIWFAMIAWAVYDMLRH